MKVLEIAAGRSGDKGAALDLTLVARDDAGYAKLEQAVTAEVAQRALNAVAPGPMRRYPLPGLRAEVRCGRGVARWRLRVPACRAALAEGSHLRPAGARYMKAIISRTRCGAETLALEPPLTLGTLVSNVVTAQVFQRGQTTRRSSINLSG